ncbi:MAG: DUF6279 family lipoprotein [Rubrivivax sp.]
MGKRAAIIGLALVLLAGCSALRLGYEQGPLLARWWLDRYVDFDDTQMPVVKEGLGQWFAWHRSTQMPDYAQLLGRLREEALQPATADQMCRWMDDVRRRAVLATDALLPQAARVAPLLSAAQIDDLQSRLDKRNADFRKKVVQPRVEDRRRESAKRTVERIEDFYGRLDAAQRQLVAASLEASPFDAEAWYADRLAQQREIVATLRRLQAERADRERALVVLRALHARLTEPPPADPQSYAQRVARHNCEFAARLHNSTTPAQRQHLRDKLKGWEGDVRVLLAANRAG